MCRCLRAKPAHLQKPTETSCRFPWGCAEQTLSFQVSRSCCLPEGAQPPDSHSRSSVCVYCFLTVCPFLGPEKPRSGVQDQAVCGRCDEIPQMFTVSHTSRARHGSTYSSSQPEASVDSSDSRFLTTLNSKSLSHKPKSNRNKTPALRAFYCTTNVTALLAGDKS